MSARCIAARFMGDDFEPLAVLFADLQGRPRQRVLERRRRVHEQLSWSGGWARRLLVQSAVRGRFAAARRERLPGGYDRWQPAEQLPFPDDLFDAALAQLVHFMADPVAGLRETGRVTRPGQWARPGVWITPAICGPL